MYEYKAKVQDVSPACGVKMVIDFGLGYLMEHTLQLHGIRVLNQDTTREWLRTELPRGTEVILNTVKVSNRFFATLYVQGQSMNVNDMLVAEGLAVEVDGSVSTKAGK